MRDGGLRLRGFKVQGSKFKVEPAEVVCTSAECRQRSLRADAGFRRVPSDNVGYAKGKCLVPKTDPDQNRGGMTNQCSNAE